MKLDDSDVTQIAVLLSTERLARLQKLAGSTSAAIELHQEILGLGTSLLNVIAIIEITLRNAVCENLSQYFAVENWLFQPPVPFQWENQERGKITQALENARRAKYSKLSQKEKGNLDYLAYPDGRPSNISHLKRAKDRRKQIKVSDGSVIAELTFYFWKRLYGADYEHTLWRTTLKKTFPNKSLSRAKVAENLEILYQSRNRLAHHEPVLRKRFGDTIKSVQFITKNLGMKKQAPDSPLAKLVSGNMKAVMAKADHLHARLDSYRKK